MRKLNKILSAFTKTINDLNELSALNDKRVHNNTSIITGLQEANLSLIAESTAARNLANNLKNILEGEVGTL